MSQEDVAQLLARIAGALERLAPPNPDRPDFSAAEAFVWRAAGGSRPPDRSPGERPVARAAAALVCFLSMALTLAGVTFETVVLDVDRHYLIALVPILRGIG